MVRFGVAVVGALLLAGCGGGEVASDPAPSPARSSAPATTEPAPTVEVTSPEANPDCLPVDQPLIDAIATGAQEDFTPGPAAAFRSPDHEEVYLVAVRFDVEGVQGNEGVWATNSLTPGEGLILAADGMAGQFTDWPKASDTEAGIDAGSPGVAEAKACLPAEG